MLGWTRSRKAPALWAALFAGAALLLGLRTVQSDPPAADHRARTVVVVRHGEKETSGDARDPALSPAGVKRAEALARILADAHVTHLFASEFKRTQETLAPLAKARSVTITAVPARETDRLIADISVLPAGAVCVIAGHSNTVPQIVARLAHEVSGLVDSPSGRVLPDDEFSRMFVITLPPEGARASCDATVLELRYGD